MPPVDELLALLEQEGVEDAPRKAPDPAAHQALLELALHVAERQKRIRFAPFSWDDPGFFAEDEKVTFRIVLDKLADASPAALDATLQANLPRLRPAPGLLALDARASGVREFALEHALYGEVTLFQHRARPPESADRRLDAARAAGWTKTLKEHNLLPGRGLVVLDEHQGLLLREPALDALPGLFVLYPSGQVHLYWNPVCPAASSDWQYWLAWGRGTQASEWRRVFEAHEADEQ